MAKKKAQPKARLDRVQEHYLLTNPDGLTNEKLAEVLNVSVKTVYNYLKKNKPPAVSVTEQVVVTPTQATQPDALIAGPKFDDLMGKAKHARKPDSIVGAIMTPAASELADAHRAAHRITMSEAMKAAIHQPKRKS